MVVKRLFFDRSRGKFGQKGTSGDGAFTAYAVRTANS